jgi:hypothetical protein
VQVPGRGACECGARRCLSGACASCGDADPALGDADPALERFLGRAAADLPCDCVQRDAGHTMALMHAQPGDAL